MDALTDFIANSSHFFDRPTLGIVQRPVVLLEARDEWTFVAAAHRDQERRSLCELAGEALRSIPPDLQARFAHHIDNDRVHLFARIGAGRCSNRARRFGNLVKERGGHLRPAGVVHAREDHAFHA